MEMKKKMRNLLKFSAPQSKQFPKKEANAVRQNAPFLKISISLDREFSLFHIPECSKEHFLSTSSSSLSEEKRE